MSRHRLVRNMNIQDELDDDAIDDGEDDLSPQDYEKLNNCLEQIRSMVGPEEQSGMSDEDIKQTLLYYYFDVQQSLNWLYEEQERRRAAQERRDDKPLPPIPGEIFLEEAPYPYPHGPVVIPINGRTNLPFYEVQPEEGDDFYYYEEEDQRPDPPLSVINEVTEPDTEDYHGDWRRMSTFSRAESVSTVTTDYGQVIGPTMLPPSPSPSALQRLSLREPPPSASSTGSRTPTQETMALPVVDPPTPPPIAIQSRGVQLAEAQKAPSPSPSPVPVPRSVPLSGLQALVAERKTVTSTDSAIQKPKSKLSALASSRASLSSKSSGSFGSDTGSVATYAPLRPSSASFVISAPSEAHSDGASVVSRASSTSTVTRAVRAAIQQAMQPEPEVPPPVVPQEPEASTMAPPKAPALVANTTVSEPRSSLELPASRSPASRSPDPKARPTSKLAQLAQAKAQQGARKLTPTRILPDTGGLTMRKSHTEILTPIANGPTATTAITTTYQTLSDLARPTRSSGKSSQTVNMFAPRISSGEEPRRSKLAMKSKKTQLPINPEPEPDMPTLDLPMFTDAPRSRASPSAFASLLINDESAAPEDKGQKESSLSKDQRAVLEKPRRRKHKRHEVPPPPSSATSSVGFAFDGPSPDDVVFSARRGTSVSRSMTASTHLPASTPGSRPSSTRSSALGTPVQPTA